MKEIYILKVAYEYEGSDVIGVFTGLNQALKGMRDYMSLNSFYDSFIVEKVYPNQVYDEITQYQSYDANGTLIKNGMAL